MCRFQYGTENAIHQAVFMPLSKIKIMHTIELSSSSSHEAYLFSVKYVIPIQVKMFHALERIIMILLSRYLEVYMFIILKKYSCVFARFGRVRTACNTAPTQTSQSDLL